MSPKKQTSSQQRPEEKKKAEDAFVEKILDLLNWSVIDTAFAGDDGVLQLSDTAPPSPEAYYRTITPVP